MCSNEGVRYFLVAFVSVVQSIPIRDVAGQLLDDTRGDEAMASVGVARISGFHPERGETTTHDDILFVAVPGTPPGRSMGPPVETLATDDVTGATTADETERNLTKIFNKPDAVFGFPVFTIMYKYVF